MKKLAFAVATLLSTSVFAASGTYWGYDDETGPEHWGEMGFNTCSQGKNQSPINIEGLIEAELAPIEFSYADAKPTEMLNNGHTVQVNYAAGSTISVDGTAFELKQFHFHTPSENHITGKSYPMEAHFVHADKDGNLAVVGVMFEEGEENALLASLWKDMPKNAGNKVAVSAGDPLSMLPEDKDYYRFNGSLTTPPCTEGVRWLVMKNAITASKEQVEAFTHTMHHGNNRPVQAVNARPVLQ